MRRYSEAVEAYFRERMSPPHRQSEAQSRQGWAFTWGFLIQALSTAAEWNTALVDPKRLSNVPISAPIVVRSFPHVLA
jgi:hypothetical protein